jgi:hypothetical protein
VAVAVGCGTGVEVARATAVAVDSNRVGAGLGVISTGRGTSGGGLGVKKFRAAYTPPTMVTSVIETMRPICKILSGLLRFIATFRAGGQSFPNHSEELATDALLSPLEVVRLCTSAKLSGDLTLNR